jgi:hypothetical protein
LGVLLWTYDGLSLGRNKNLDTFLHYEMKLIFVISVMTQNGINIFLLNNNPFF